MALARIHQGSALVLEIENGRMIIQPSKFDLETMLQEITPKNQHHQILDNEKKGNEEW